jgi:hypothetical protein
VNLTDSYNTPLTPDEEAAFASWAKAGGKDPERERYDYDLQGYFKKNPGPMSEGHLTDEFKKPNHPTFSNESIYHGVDGNEGGVWGQKGDKYIFTPGQSNMDVWGPQSLQEYFDKFEPGNSLLLSPEGR